MIHRDAFFKYLQYEKRYSAHTLLSYTNDLNQFYTFGNSVTDNFSALTSDYRLIRKWVVSLMENKISPRSVNRKITALKSFYKFLIKEGLLEKNPLDKITAPKVTKMLPFFVDKKHINLLLDEVDFGETFEGVRNRLIVEIFYQTGIRRAELINIKINDIDFSNCTLKVLGKRNKERIIPFNNGLKKEIEDYKKVRDNEFGNLANNYLFLTQKGEKMYEKLVYRIVHKYLQMVTTIDKKSPHVMRHTFATHMLNNGADLNAIKELLGHSNLSATQVYTHNTFEKLKSIYKQAHPRA